MICENLGINKEGHLTFAGQDTVLLAEKYQTPLYLFDEDRIRQNCRVYRKALARAFGEGALPLYAGKAACFTHIYRIMKEEGMGIDVVSLGEVYTAKNASFPLQNAYFHSNNKTDRDIAVAMELGVGTFVADNREEVDAISREAVRRGVEQRVLLRLTPGIDPHTYAAVATGRVDSKFGSAIETGQAEELCRYTTLLPGVRLAGFHCHVGSQVFDADVFVRSARIMLAFIADMQKNYGFETEELDLGGGFGVPYLASHPTPDVGAIIDDLALDMKKTAKDLGIPLPKIRMEPGRSIVADAGMTLYTVGTVKRIPGYRNYVSVDGGMADNPRYALYRSPYTVLSAERPEFSGESFEASVVGRCCESGDILQEGVTLPADIGRGEILAVLTTGAYNYSMASHYNRLPNPPVVMLKEGQSFVAVRRETEEDLLQNDL